MGPPGGQGPPGSQGQSGSQGPQGLAEGQGPPDPSGSSGHTAYGISVGHRRNMAGTGAATDGTPLGRIELCAILLSSSPCANSSRGARNSAAPATNADRQPPGPLPPPAPSGIPVDHATVCVNRQSEIDQVKLEAELDCTRMEVANNYQMAFAGAQVANMLLERLRMS